MQFHKAQKIVTGTFPLLNFILKSYIILQRSDEPY
jgi:hypothetical protein